MTPTSKIIRQLPQAEFDKKKYIDDLLNSNDWPVEQLAIQPGEPTFPFWFTVSSYFPLIVGTIGPLSNLANIVSLIDSWRVHEVTGEKIKDYSWLLKLNGISVMFALISNASLLLNIRQKMRYKLSQVISILGWFIAATILLVLVIVGHFLYFHNTDYKPSQGYWFAVFTVVLYYCCFAVLVINEIGFLLNKYPPVFNIDDVQKNLMVLIIILMIFLICGSAVFAKLMDTHFANALYFVVVTILTVGLGDFVPYNPGGKVLILIYSVIGLLLLALIISTIRELVIFTASSTFNWHSMERHRIEALLKLQEQGLRLEDEECFELMMKVAKNGLLREKAKSLVNVLTIFIAFWLIGAAIFCKAESWDYGTSCYFCFLCLVTIGYGTPSPNSAAGRAFFVIWGLGAVPLMTMLISNMADILFASLKDTNNYSLLDPLLRLSSRCAQLLGILVWQIHQLLHNLIHRSREDMTDLAEAEKEEEEMSTSLENWILRSEAPEYIGTPLSDLPEGASDTAKELRQVLEMTKELRRMMIIAIENPTRRFTHAEWVKMYQYVDEDEQRHETDNFWLSDESPFVFPFKQCHFFEFKYLITIEKRLKKILKDSELDYVEERLNDYVHQHNNNNDFIEERL